MRAGAAARPIEALRAIERRYPRVWDFAAICRDAKGEIQDWPPYCWLPMAAWNATIHNDVRYLPLVAAAGTWRLSKGVYCFDDDLARELMRTPMSEKAPTGAFYNLPEYCIYIDTPHNSSYSGVFAHLEWDAEPNPKYSSTDDPHSELRLLYLPRNGDVLTGTLPIMLHIDDNSIINSLREVYASRSEEVLENIGGELALLLYLCSEKPDMGDRVPPARAIAKRVKGREKWIPKQKPEMWSVGVRIGAAIRRYGSTESSNDSSDTTPTGRTVRPHIRRAHWHGFWTGSRKTPAQQRFIYRWIPPIPVNVTGKDDELPAVLHDVKD